MNKIRQLKKEDIKGYRIISLKVLKENKYSKITNNFCLEIVYKIKDYGFTYMLNGRIKTFEELMLFFMNSTDFLYFVDKFATIRKKCYNLDGYKENKLH